MITGEKAKHTRKYRLTNCVSNACLFSHSSLSFTMYYLCLFRNHNCPLFSLGTNLIIMLFWQLYIVLIFLMACILIKVPMSSNVAFVLYFLQLSLHSKHFLFRQNTNVLMFFYIISQTYALIIIKTSKQIYHMNIISTFGLATSLPLNLWQCYCHKPMGSVCPSHSCLVQTCQNIALHCSIA